MTQFKDRPFTARLGSMGDEAENKFEETYDGNFVRYGLNRPPLSMWMLSPKIRYTPDYLTSHGLIEVQGVGNDRKLKIKVEKGVALQQWHEDMPLRFFVWDSKLKRHTLIDWAPLWDLLPSMPLASFPEGKEYWEINVDTFVWDGLDAQAT